MREGLDMKLLGVGLFFLLLVGCATSSMNSLEKEVIPLAGAFQVHRYQLGNGLKVLIVEDHSSPTFAYQTWFQVGSRNELVGKTGLAHLFEHMMFKETQNHKLGDFDRLLEVAGAYAKNAFTNRDYTAYIQELPKSQLDLIASLESDRMVNLKVNQKIFQTETEVVQNERRFRTENDPDGLLFQEIFGLAFTQHPYRWPVVGYQKDLDQMTSEDAIAFYKSYYSPNHATLAVVGDVDPDEVIQVVKKYYGKLEPQPIPQRRILSEPIQTSVRRKEMKLAIQVEKLMMAYHIPEFVHEDMQALRVLQAVLTGGRTSRLYQALVEPGIASSAESEAFQEKDPSIYLIFSNLQKGRKAEEAENVILRELEKLKKNPITQEELEIAKDRVSFSFYESLNSSFLKCLFLGKYETLAGDFRFGLKHFEKVKSVTAADIQKVAQRYLNPNSRSVVIGAKK